MGLFDYVHVCGPEFVCSEGHDLSDEEFQTKDLGCTMGAASVDSDALHFDTRADNWGGPQYVDENPVSIYADCHKCPAFVQGETGVVIATPVEFSVTVGSDNKVISIKRTSPDSDVWAREEANKLYLKDSFGPISYETALAKSAQIWDSKPGRP
jgi:hypothetical protein